MKQRKPLARRTPLRTKTSLERTGWLKSSGPIKAKRRDTGPKRTVRDLVRERAGNRCEHCGRTEGRLDIHHRRPRAMGGTSDPAANLPSNLVLLCRPSHDWFEAMREMALAAGWLVAQGADPAAKPVRMGGRWVLLLNDGSSTELIESERAS